VGGLLEQRFELFSLSSCQRPLQLTQTFHLQEGTRRRVAGVLRCRAQDKSNHLCPQVQDV
jgi:hypothetical protein